MVCEHKTVIAHQENAARYEVRIQGHLDPRRLDCFENTTIAHLSDGETRIVGLLKDQSALYGLLNHLYNLGVTLLSVQRSIGIEENKRPPPQSSSSDRCRCTHRSRQGIEGGNCTKERQT